MCTHREPTDTLGTFDAVISIFHVFSYLGTDEELDSAIKTANVHLKQGGL